jgi:hypothetical protein
VIVAAKKAFLVRIDRALYGDLEKWAHDELRSVNGQIEYVLRAAVLRRKKAQEAGDDAGKDARAR